MFLSTKETCLRLRKSRWTVMDLIKSGELDAVKGPTRNSHLHITEESITRYIERHRVPAALDRSATEQRRTA